MYHKFVVTSMLSYGLASPSRAKAIVNTNAVADERAARVQRGGTRAFWGYVDERGRDAGYAEGRGFGSLDTHAPGRPALAG